jgi:hypothetical protein
MSLSILETERLLQSVHETLLALIYDEVSGIPEVRQTLEAHGLTLNIQIEATASSDAPRDSEEAAPSDDVEGGLSELRDMGIVMDDFREVAGMEARRVEEAEGNLFQEIRSVSANLSQRGRNYTWGWLHLHYPEIGLGPSPTTVQDQRFQSLATPYYWKNLVETALSAIVKRQDKKEILDKFLATVNFAIANT